MSKLQTALHAYPPGSVVTRAMLESDKQLHSLLRTQAEAEKRAAKAIQRATGCTWGEALRAALHHP